MNGLLIAILVVLFLILGAILFWMTILFLYKKAPLEKLSQDERVLKLTKEQEEDLFRLQEEEMIRYARSKMNTNITPQMRESGDNRNRPVRVGSKSKELVPFNLSETEKRLWEEFNS